MLSARRPAPSGAAGIFVDDPAATFFRFGKAARVQKQISEKDSSYIVSDNAQKKQTRKTKYDPLTRLRGRSRFGAAKARPAGHPLPARRGEGQGEGRNYFRIQSVFHP
jgi:hypothetical protein